MVERIRGQKYAEFMSARGDWGRPLLLWCLRNYCAMTLREIGEATGGVDYSAVQMMITRFEQRAQKNLRLSSYMQRIKEIMLNVET